MRARKRDVPTWWWEVVHLFLGFRGTGPAALDGASVHLARINSQSGRGAGGETGRGEDGDGVDIAALQGGEKFFVGE